jgi:hypothetical protein
VVAVSGEQANNDAPSFNEITREYQSSPTIENYVRLRRKYPHIPPQIGTTGEIEFVFAMAEDLLSFGIDPSLVEGAMEADKAAQAELSLVLLELIIERQKRQKDGETHIVSRKKVISDTFVNYLIATCLDALDWNQDLAISPELAVLLKHQLGPITSRYESEEDKRQKQHEAMMVALQIAANGETPSYRKIAHAMGVEATTVMRWFRDQSFISEAKTFVGVIKELRPPVSVDPTTRSKGKKLNASDNGNGAEKKKNAHSLDEFISHDHKRRQRCAEIL